MESYENEVQELKEKIARLEFENELCKDDFLHNVLTDRNTYVELYKTLMAWYDTSLLVSYFVVYKDGKISTFLDPVQAGIECGRNEFSFVVKCGATSTGTKYYETSW